MELFYEPFSMQKFGNSENEFEDAYWPARKSQRITSKFSTAIADGATESSFSAQWARLLVRSYCRGAFEKTNIECSLQRSRREWKQYLDTIDLPWYASAKALQGAHSSLAGIRLTQSSSGRGTWSSVAAGDSCVFQLRKNTLVKSFPLDSPEKFNSRPSLLSSIAPTTITQQCELFRTGGEWQVDDCFFLMTDALAAWFLQAYQNGEERWLALRDVGYTDNVSFETLIHDLRQSKEIRNDDVTFLRLTVE